MQSLSEILMNYTPPTPHTHTHSLFGCKLVSTRPRLMSSHSTSAVSTLARNKGHPSAHSVFMMAALGIIITAAILQNRAIKIIRYTV